MILLVVLLSVFLSVAQAQQVQTASELPEDYPRIRFRINPFYHSIGVKLGHVLNVRRERPIFSTYEGEMMLGFGTNPDNVIDRQCQQSILQQGTRTRRSAPQQQDEELQAQIVADCTLFVNPWRFSFLSTDLFKRMSVAKDRPVVIYYINYYVTPAHILMNTGNEVLNVFPVQPDLNIERSYRIPSWKDVHPESGVVTGRVVHASLEYPVRKTYEIIIQESENANNFRALSVTNRGLFQYITRAMLTGKRLRVEYIRLYGPHAALMTSIFNVLTNLRVIGVEILDE